MDNSVQEMAKRVATRYGKALSHFRPCKPGSELLEQNLITLLSHEFLAMYSQDERCMAFSEIPFKSAANPNNWCNRLDGFLANSDVAYLVEAKSSKHKKYLIADIKADLDRIKSDVLKDSFAEMASTGGRAYKLPPSVRGLVIADFWCLSDKLPWFNESEFEASLLPEHKVKALVEKIGTFGRYNYFLLVAQTDTLDW